LENTGKIYKCMFSLFCMEKEEKKKGSKGFNGQLESVRKTFRSSKIDDRYWKVFFYDLMLFVVGIIVIAGFVLIAFSYFDSFIQQPDFMNTLEGSELGIDSAAAMMLGKLVIIVFLFLIVNFLIGGFFKTMMWKRAVRKKNSWKFYGKFLGFKIISLASIFILFWIGSIIFAATQSKVLFAIFLLGMIFLIHLFSVSLINLSNTDNFKESIQKGFKTGTKKLHLFILPYIMMGAIYLVYNLVKTILNKFIGPNVILDFQNTFEIASQMVPYIKEAWPFLLITSVIATFFTAYIRIFYVETVKKI